jgi:glutathione S-transferase
MDSSLILQHIESLAGQGRSLLPTNVEARQHAFRIIGLGLAACDKSVQLVYERTLRPADKQHAPWIARVTAQLLAAYGELSGALTHRALGASRETIEQSGITTAVAWRFSSHMLPDIVLPRNYPAVHEFSARAESLPEFKAAPYGTARYPYSEARVDELAAMEQCQSPKARCSPAVD